MQTQQQLEAQPETEVTIGDDEEDDVTTVIEDGGLQFLQNPHDPATLTVQSLSDDVHNALHLATQNAVTSAEDANDAHVDQLITFAPVQDNNNLLQQQQQQVIDTSMLSDIQLQNVLQQVAQ